MHGRLDPLFWGLRQGKDIVREKHGGVKQLMSWRKKERDNGGREGNRDETGSGEGREREWSKHLAYEPLGTFEIQTTTCTKNILMLLVCGFCFLMYVSD